MRSVRPRLVTIPSSDSVFREVVSRVGLDAGRSGDIEARLRLLYPKARVRPRELSAEPTVLYVYRDGRYEPDSAERWWTQPDVARVRIAAETGVLLAANDAWREAMGTPSDRTAGRPYTDFVRPEARAEAATLFEAIVAAGSVTSEVLVQRPDGRLLMLEFHAERVGDAVEVAYRTPRGA